MTLISIDPSTTTVGVVIWELDDNLNILSIDSFTLTVFTTFYIETRILRIHRRLTRLINSVRPYQLVHESGFLDRFRPMAFGPLSAAIFGIRTAFKELYGLNDDTGIFQYPPKTVKASVAVGGADKIDMKKAVYALPELKPFITNCESEHVIDALAIGYTHIKNLRAYPELLLL